MYTPHKYNLHFNGFNIGNWIRCDITKLASSTNATDYASQLLAQKSLMFSDELSMLEPDRGVRVRGDNVSSHVKLVLF